jgi:phosphopantothenoylcysteine decarboxylase/phosphopantothenate--cysteine ligase
MRRTAAGNFKRRRPLSLEKGKPMQRLYRKRIVLGVGGGIAAYKSAELVRRLLDHGAKCAWS